jgi:Domain of unknown function (DUF4153)
MRFPSLETLGARGLEVMLRFPWTVTAAIVAAAAAITATAESDDTLWIRVAMVAALGLPLTIALALMAEERGWSRARSAVVSAGGVVVLVLFFLVWPGVDRKFQAIRYFQLSAGLHLLVAALPFLGQRETTAFWQYNRRLFESILRAVLFSLVLFIGLAIALGALDQLFGVSVPGEVYGRLFLVIALVLNTVIFLAGVPRNLRSLNEDDSYPRVLKIFAQYILTPIVFLYLVLLLAYLVKIIAGGEWPSGWIGWLVSSVAVAGLLGFLLVHPLRTAAGEAWIRTYTRWFFIGLIPAALVLLVAFWKRVLPYGLTELRLLGLLLGLWLLGIALVYTIRPGSGIRRIPVTLAALFLLTVYGPFSITALSLVSQERRLKHLIAQSRAGHANSREASAALRFLLEHGAQDRIAGVTSRKLPSANWDSVPDQRSLRDSVARTILASEGIAYTPEYHPSRDGFVHIAADRDAAVPLSGYDWMFELSSNESGPLLAGADTVHLDFDPVSMITRIRVGHDTMRFDIGRQGRRVLEDSTLSPHTVPAERLRFLSSGAKYRSRLDLDNLRGTRKGDSVWVQGWHGKFFLGRKLPPPGTQ